MKSRERKLKRRNYIKNGIGVLTVPGGKKFIVDAEDFERCKDILWRESTNGYAYNDWYGYLHRFVIMMLITDPDEFFDFADWEVDHINRDKCDCRRSNLRIVTHQENCQNRGGRYADTSV